MHTENHPEKFLTPKMLALQVFYLLHACTQIVSGFIILFPSAILFSIRSNHYSCIEITVFCAHSLKQSPICLLNV